MQWIEKTRYNDLATPAPANPSTTTTFAGKEALLSHRQPAISANPASRYAQHARQSAVSTKFLTIKRLGRIFKLCLFGLNVRYPYREAFHSKRPFGLSLVEMPFHFQAIGWTNK